MIKTIQALKILAKDNNWTESEHPRATDGKFGSGSSVITHAQKDGMWTTESGDKMSTVDHDRMKTLSVPPAWTGVKLNPDPTGSLQVIGKDAKGRSQYLYSSEHSSIQSAAKFARLEEFTALAPKILNRAKKDMLDQTLTQVQRDCAAVTLLIAETGFRIGSDEDTGADVKAHGATTLVGSHVTIVKSKIVFSFTGKKGVHINKELKNTKLADYITERKNANGDTGQIFNANDSQVRDYFHKTAKSTDFKVKDFRTWNGTSVAINEIAKLDVPTTRQAYEKARLNVARVVAEHLGNTPSVALESYISPSVFAVWGFTEPKKEDMVTSSNKDANKFVPETNKGSNKSSEDHSKTMNTHMETHHYTKPCDWRKVYKDGKVQDTSEKDD